MGEPTHILTEVSFGVNSFTVLSANINQSTKLAVLKKLPKNGYQGLRSEDTALDNLLIMVFSYSTETSARHTS